MYNNLRPTIKPSLLSQTTPDTKLYVDYEWWQNSGMDLRSYLYRRLSINEELDLESERDEVDLIDPQTGEVRRVDGFQYMVQTYFSQLPDDFASRTALVDAVFCVLLANGNQPMAVSEIAKRVQRSSDVVLKTLTGPRIYQGIRPFIED